MVDAAIGNYGTLYAGGSHQHQLDTVGATLDLYRLWRGLPDISLRSVRPPRWGDEDFEYDWNDVSGDEIWTRAAGLVEQPDAGDREARLFTAWGADALTSAGPAPDWWLHAEAFPSITPTQQHVAELVAREPVLDWLQVLLAASNTPGAAFSHLASPSPDAAMSRLGEHALERYAPAEGHAWAVAAALVQEGSTPEQDAWLAGLERKVLDCTASTADHAAWAVVVHGRDRWTLDPEDADEARRLAFLPPYARVDLLDQRLMRRVAAGQLPADADWWAALLPEENLGAHRLQGRLDYVRALAASTPQALPPPDQATVVRLLNGLSSEDLAAYAEHHALEAWLMPVLYARAVALEDWQAAEELLPPLAESSAAAGEVVRAVRSIRGPQAVKLAWVALHLDAMQLHICGGNSGADFGLNVYQFASCHAVELPTDYADGAAFDRDLRIFFRVPARWDAFFGMHGSTLPRIERIGARGMPMPPDIEASLPSIVGGPFPISSRLDLTVAAATTGPPVLMPWVATTIIEWADAQTDGPLKRFLPQARRASDSLANLIRRCRHTPCGEVGGRPAQLVAFELLHRRMPDSGAAQATPIWWASPER